MRKNELPSIFFDWANCLCSAPDVRSIPTFMELPIGSTTTRTGFATDARMAIIPKRHWGSYCKRIRQGARSYIALARKLLAPVIRTFKLDRLSVVFDDTFVPRSSKKAPDVKYHRRHGSKPNRPRFVFGQCWPTMAVALGNGSAIPIVSRLVSTTGNTGKPLAAKVVVGATRSILGEIETTVSVDSRLARKTLLLPVPDLRIDAIGRVGIDTAPYDIPEPRKQPGRGRPRLYGEKYSKERVEALPAKCVKMFVYDKDRLVRYREPVAKARFPEGRVVRGVFRQFESENGKISKPGSIPSTDIRLSAEEVPKRYAKRRAVEPMFDRLKNSWGLGTAWQRSGQVPSRRARIVSLSCAIPRMSTNPGEENVKAPMADTPWRADRPVTAGRARHGLRRIFRHFRVRSWRNPKSRKFEPPKSDETEIENRKRPKAS